MEYLYTPRYCYISPLCFTAQRSLQVHDQLFRATYSLVTNGVSLKKPINTRVLAGLIVMVIHFLQAARKHATLPGTEDAMTTHDFITALFCQVDDQLPAIPKHPEAHLWPSEIVTLGLLHALKGVRNRAFYRWLTRDYRPLFPRLPERTRLFLLLTTPQDWTTAFLPAPTVLLGIDTHV